MATLLQLVQQATAEMGIAVPTAVVGNTNQQVIQLLALTNAVGYEVQREHQWQRMTQEHVFTTEYTETTGDLTSGSTTITNIPSTAGLDSTYQVMGTGINNATNVATVPSGTSVTITQAATASGTGVSLTFGKVKYDFPSDFDRLIDRTDWDKSQHWEMLGPESPQQWQWLKSGYISTGPRVRFRQLDNYFQIWPLISDSHSLGFEYISKYWVIATGGSQPSKESFTVDTDTCIFPDRIMVLGLKRKFLEAKGFDATAVTRDYTMQMDIAKAADAGSATLNYSPRISSVLIGWENIPDSSYGS